MVPIVSRGPLSSTYIAEVVAALAFHVIAALVLLNYHFAIFALPIVEIFLEEHQLLQIAVP